MSDKVMDIIDVNKTDGKPKLEFGSDFLTAFSESLKVYDDTLDQLESIVKGSKFTESYGICNTRYQMIYITPKDIASYISYLFKAISKRLVACNVPDLEKLSVELAKQFVVDNSGVKMCRDNLLGFDSYMDPRTETLLDLLVQAQNTFFDRAVYSKYELTERAKDMKKDYDTINGMHFPAAMKAVVNALPNTIKDTMKDSLRDGIVCCDCGLVMKYIETFILFVCSLNTCTLEQMIAYAIPRSTFDSKDRRGEIITQESFSRREYAPLFIVLSSGTAPLSHQIQKITKSKWSHCSLAFDAGLKEMFSYGARLQDDPDHPKKMGMKRESLQASNLADKDICVFGFYIPKDAHEAIHQEALRRYDDKDNSKFDIGLLIKKAFNDDTTGSKDDTKKICTTFTNDLIKMCGKAFSDKAVPSPQQMRDAAEMTPDQCKLVFDGNAKDYNGEDVDKKMKSFARTKVAKPWQECVMECAIIKTNDVNLSTRMPFDCNMRNVVLQDCTPNFKDTKSAIHFMLKSERSPIRTMLVKYSTMDSLPTYAMCAPTIEMFRPYFHKCEEDFGLNDNGRGFLADRCSFFTDVNWLDKISYGNQFYDSNYRLDAVGNDERHPLVETMKMLHRMYCGCTLKDNSDIADNIIRISGVMHHIIDSVGLTCNRQLVTDILCVLGECFTKNVLKLYHNTHTVITYDDNMCDTMIPGFTYCEQFVFTEADEGKENNGGPQVEIGGQPVNTAPKNGVLSKLTGLIRSFGKWIQTKFANVPNSFNALNAAKTAWIKTHDKVNKSIGQAIANGNFKPNLKYFPMYKIPAKDVLSKEANVQNVTAKFLGANKDNPITDEELQNYKADLYPGDDATATKIAQAQKEDAVKLIKNYILFSTTEPNEQQTSYTGAMTADIWNSIVSDLLNSQKLIEEVSRSMTKALQTSLKAVESQMKSDEAAANKAQQNGGEDTNTQGGKSNAQKMFDMLQEVAANYQMNTINTITKEFFNTYYEAYKKIVDAYQAQTSGKAAKENAVNTVNPQENGAEKAGTPTADQAVNPETPAENPSNT